MYTACVFMRMHKYLLHLCFHMHLSNFKLTSVSCNLHFLGLIMHFLHTCISICPIHMHACVHKALIHVYAGHKIYIHTYKQISTFLFFFLFPSFDIIIFYYHLYFFLHCFFFKLLSAFTLKIYAHTQHTN